MNTSTPELQTLTNVRVEATGQLSMFVSGAVGFRVESQDADTEAVFDDLMVSATG